jgi:ABC-type nitrate/sulfonate/bicarbonate transport system permease component
MERRFSRSLASVALPLSGIVAALLIVEFLKSTGHLPSTVPAPSEVWAVLARDPRGIFRSVAETATSAGIGYAIAVGIALTAASVGALATGLRLPIYNLGVVLSSVPLIAATPLLALWLGNGMLTRSLVAGLASYFPMLVGAMQGFRASERSYRELFHVYSASPWQVFRSLTLPTALPYLFAGFKLAAPLAVLGSLTAEWAGADNGLGVLLLSALFNFDSKLVWLMVLMSCALAGGGYAAWAIIERFVIYWESPVELKN